MQIKHILYFNIITFHSYYSTLLKNPQRKMIMWFEVRIRGGIPRQNGFWWGISRCPRTLFPAKVVPAGFLAVI